MNIVGALTRLIVNNLVWPIVRLLWNVVRAFGGSDNREKWVVRDEPPRRIERDISSFSSPRPPSPDAAPKSE